MAQMHPKGEASKESVQNGPFRVAAQWSRPGSEDSVSLEKPSHQRLSKTVRNADR